MAAGGAGPAVRIAEPGIDPDRLDGHLALLREEVAASVAGEPGVPGLLAVSLAGGPASVRPFGAYADRAAYGAHLRSPHVLRYKALTKGMVLSLRPVGTAPVILRAKPPG